MKKLLLVAALIVPFALSTAALGTEGDPHKVAVCKYVGTPGVDERLQTGQNPIEVDVAALEGDGFVGIFPFEFSDAQGRSIAIGYVGEGFPVLTIEDCPGSESPSPSPSPSESESPSPSESESPTPSESLIPPSASRSPNVPVSGDRGGTAFTGSDAGLLGIAALALLLIGAAVLRFSSRRSV